jgi:hypothetical protein
MSAAAAFTVEVVGPEKQPLVTASVTLSPGSNIRAFSEEKTTGTDGRVTFVPETPLALTRRLVVQKAGFVPFSTNLTAGTRLPPLLQLGLARAFTPLGFTLVARPTPPPDRLTSQFEKQPPVAPPVVAPPVPPPRVPPGPPAPAAPPEFKLPEFKLPEFKLPELPKIDPLNIFAPLRDFITETLFKFDVKGFIDKLLGDIGKHFNSYRQLLQPRSPKKLDQAVQEALTARIIGNAIAGGAIAGTVAGSILSLGTAAEALDEIYRLPDVAAPLDLATRIIQIENDIALVRPYTRALNAQWTPEVPGAQDLIRFLVREAFDQASVTKFGMDDGYENVKAVFEPFMRQQGFDDFWSRMFWRTKWQFPAVGQGFEMLHRGVLEERDLDALMIQLDILPFWHKKLLAISFNPIPRVDIRRMYDLGLIDDDDLDRSNRDIGLSPENAVRMTSWIKADRTLRDLLTPYRRGFINEDDLRAELLEANIPPDRVDAMIFRVKKAEKGERTAKERDLTKGEIVKAAKKRAKAVDDIDGLNEFLSTAQADLDAELIRLKDAGVAEAEIEKVRQEELTRIGRSRAKLKRQQRLVAVLPPLEETTTMLTQLGYDQAEADFILTVELGVAAGSPDTVPELKQLTGKYRKSQGLKAEAVSEAELLRVRREKKLLAALEAEEQAAGAT